jgi:hypothetical protein
MSKENKMQVSLGSVLTIIFFTVPIHAQQASGAPGMDEERIAKGMDDYGLSGRQKTYEALGQTAALSLTPMLPWIEKRLGRIELRKAKEAPLRNLRYDFSVILREDEERRVSEGYGLEISLAPTIEGAGRLVMNHFLNIALDFTKGSYSGMAIGDWTAHSKWSAAHLVFTRRNAYVRLRCAPPVEFSKQSKDTRSLPDPLVKHRCEELARDIDAQIEKLPGTEN